MVGKTVSHYTILERVGGGGMGIVYKAEDTRLKRTVALKFLPPELSRDLDAKNRFMQEARAASSLQHNNICTVHDIGESDDGHMFIVMDLYEGETLDKRIERGSVPVEEAVACVAQVAQGLARAHARGIVHRDIKPANILVTQDGTAKILDFGLVKFAGLTMLTKSGTTLGTAAYMSPEQARGEEVDHRTDIWSLGVILYQMLSGRLPFASDHDQAVIYAIQHTDPTALSSLRKDLPTLCEQILDKALEKDPADRYQHCEELLSDLHALTERLKGGTPPTTFLTKVLATRKHRRLLAGGVLGACVLIIAFMLLRPVPKQGATVSTAEPSLRRLAVLPFMNLRTDAQTDFLGFALADQIIGNLSYVKTLLVRPSSAVRQFQNQAVDAPTAGRTLNVDFILSGNYLKESDIIRLSIELVDVRTNGILWREEIQQKYINAFQLEDSVAGKVVQGLRLQFSPDELQRMQADIPRNAMAYDLYLRAIATPLSVEATTRAVSLLHQSVRLDSTYAPAFSELGFRLYLIANYVPGKQHVKAEAERAYAKALAINSELLNALANLTILYTDGGKTEEALETAQRALAINPNSSEGHFYLGYVYRYVGLMDEAEQEMEKALVLDPGNARFRSIGITYFYRGKYRKALEGFDLDSTGGFGLSWKGVVYAVLGDKDRSLASFNRVIAMEPGSVLGLFSAAGKGYVEGNRRYGLEALRKRERSEAIDAEQWYNLAGMHAVLQDTSGCIRALHKAVDGGFFNYPAMCTDPFLLTLRGYTPFEEILAQAKIKHETFKERVASLHLKQRQVLASPASRSGEP